MALDISIKESVATYTDSNLSSVQNQASEAKKASEVAESSATSSNGDKFELVSKSSDNSSKTYKQDIKAVKKAIAEAELKYSGFQNLVNNLFKQQTDTSIKADFDFFVKEGKLGDALKNLKVDEKTRLQAKEDISEDGYFGVKKTSERILDFAKALTGGDPSKADKMLEAFKKGYKQAVGAFGVKEEDMPDISKKTYEAVIEGFDKWKNSNKDESQKLEDYTAQQIIAQSGLSQLING